MEKKKKQEVVVIKNEDTGEVTITTPELKRGAIENSEQTRQAMRKATEGHIELGILLKKNRDEKLWRHLGYDSFQQYVELEHDIGRQYAYKHIEIVEKLPPQFVAYMRQSHVAIYRLTQLVALPQDTLKAADEKQMKEWAEMPMQDFNDEIRQTKARYAKMRRDKIRTDEKNLTLKAEKEDLLKQVEAFKEEISLLKTDEKSSKILKLLQSRDNLLEKIKQIELEKNEMQSQELKIELAIAAIDKAQNSVTTAFLDLRRIEVCPAIVPKLYSFYRWCRSILDTQITVLMERFEPEIGPTDLEGWVKEIERARRIEIEGEEKSIPEPAKEPEKETT